MGLDFLKVRCYIFRIGMYTVNRAARNFFSCTVTSRAESIVAGEFIDLGSVSITFFECLN
jgi:hypothetical protein